MAKTSTEKVTPAEGGGVPKGKTVPLEKNMFYTVFEPKTQNRFLVHLYDPKTKEHLVEPFLIKYIDRPSFTRYNGKRNWHTIRLRIYESIVPQYVLFRCLGAGVFNLQVDELGPVGDVVETWCAPEARFKEVKSTPLDWSNSGDIAEVQCELDWTRIVVRRPDGSEFYIEKKD
jgi:hypothetical protein